MCDSPHYQPSMSLVWAPLCAANDWLLVSAFWMYAIIITVIMDITSLSIRVRAAVCSIAPASLTVSGLQLVASPLKKNPQHVEESLSSPRTVVICLCYIYQKLTNSTKHSATQAPTGSSYKRSSSSSFSRWMSAAQQYNAFVRFPGKDA